MVDLSTASQPASFDIRSGPTATTRSSNQESVLVRAAPVASCSIRRLSARVVHRRIVARAVSRASPAGTAGVEEGGIAGCFLTFRRERN
jgi:hypothetical protein